MVQFIEFHFIKINHPNVIPSSLFNFDPTCFG